MTTAPPILLARTPVDITDLVRPFATAVAKRPETEHAYWIDRFHGIATHGVRSIEHVRGFVVASVAPTATLTALIAEVSAAGNGGVA